MSNPYLEYVFKGPGELVRAKDVYDFFMGVPHDGSITVVSRQYSMAGRDISEGMTCVFTLQRQETMNPDVLKIDMLMCLFDNDELVRRLNNQHWIVRYANAITIVILSEFDYQCRVKLYYEPNNIQDIYGSHNVNFLVDTFIEDFWNDIVRRWPNREYLPITNKGLPSVVPDSLAITPQQASGGGEIVIHSSDATVNVVLPGARQINQMGGVNIDSVGDVTISGDVVGRDKTVNADSSQ